MADYSIALGVRPLQIEDPLTAYSKFSAIQNAQNQNALAQYTLSAAQRGEESENALNKAYMEAYDPKTGQINLPTLRAKIAAAGVGSKLPAIEKQLAEVEKEQLARKEQLGKVINQRFEQSKSLLPNIKTAEQYVAWHKSNHADPILGPYLAERGITAESSLAQIMAELAQPGGLERLISRSTTALDKMPELLRLEQERMALSGRTPTQPMAAPPTNALAPAAPQPQPVVAPVTNALAPIAPQVQNVGNSIRVQTASVSPPAVRAMQPTFGLQGELSAVNNEIARLQGSEAAGLPGVQARIRSLEEQKARLFTALNQERTAATQERNAATSEKQAEISAEQAKIAARQAELAAEKFAFEQSIAADFKSTPAGVVRIDKVTGETRIVKDANGKPVMDVEAAKAADAARHAKVMEAQGAARIGQDAARIALEKQRIAQAEFQAKQPKFDAVAGGFVYAPTPENPQGKFVAVSGIEGKPPNEAQGNAIAFGARMNDSNRILEGLERENVTSGGRIKGFVSGTLQSLVPYQGEKLAAGAESVMRPFSSEKQNNYEQAKENFITAVLRKESGASINPDEFAREERKYFPQPGDGDSTIKQKQEARRLAISAMRQIAGPFAKNIDAISSGAAGGAPSAGAATGADPLGLRK